MISFQALPPKILLHLLVSCETLQAASLLSQTSPAVYAVWDQHWHLIVREHACRSGIPVTTDRLQDYMGVMLFPTQIKSFIAPWYTPSDGTSPWMIQTECYRASKRARVESVEAHLYRWGRGEFPNPFESTSRDARGTLIHLFNLHYRIKLYVEDLLSKATHVWRRRSYRYIPRWVHPDFSQGFSNEKLGASFDGQYDIEKNLTADERRRIFRGFLRHELLCKIYSPHRGDELVPVIIPPAPKERAGCHCNEYDSDSGCLHPPRKRWRIQDWFDPADPFRRWDWNILERYESSHRRTTLADKRLFLTVREYIKNMYLALMQNEAQLDIENPPIIMPGASLDGWGHVKPPSFSRISIMGDDSWGRRQVPAAIRRRLKRMGFHRRNDIDECFEFIISAGLDVLTAVLLSPRDDLYSLIHTLHQELNLAEVSRDDTNIIRLLDAPCEDCDYQMPGPIYTVRKFTAWAVFNNHLEPEPIDRSELIRERERARFDNRPEAYCPHSSPCGMTGSQIIHHAGGFAVYPSLSSKMVPFWTQPFV